MGLVVEWEVLEKVEIKKLAYTALVESLNEEDKWKHRKKYKKVKEAKLAALMTKTKKLKNTCMKSIGAKARLKSRIDSPSRVHDVDQVKCIKDKNGEILIEEAHIRLFRV